MELKFPPFYDIYKKLKRIYFELNVGKKLYFFYFFNLFRKITKLFSLRSIYKKQTNGWSLTRASVVIVTADN
jgi:hypothetical protein